MQRKGLDLSILCRLKRLTLEFVTTVLDECFKDLYGLSHGVDELRCRNTYDKGTILIVRVPVLQFLPKSPRSFGGTGRPTRRDKITARKKSIN
jgi:hypothetical protein